jgi:hypothetical protein
MGINISIKIIKNKKILLLNLKECWSPIWIKPMGVISKLISKGLIIGKIILIKNSLEKLFKKYRLLLKNIRME